MSPFSKTFNRALVASLVGGGLLASGTCFGAQTSETFAVSSIGDGHPVVLQLVRELAAWKARAQAAETRLVQAGFPSTADGGVPALAQAKVVGSLESERIVILSAGRTSGAVLGSLVSVGDGVLAKVVESREKVSAAVVDQTYQGPVTALEGKYARLFVVRP
jgi:hypothetical protein